MTVLRTERSARRRTDRKDAHFSRSLVIVAVLVAVTLASTAIEHLFNWDGESTVNAEPESATYWLGLAKSSSMRGDFDAAVLYSRRAAEIAEPPHKGRAILVANMWEGFHLAGARPEPSKETRRIPGETDRSGG